MTLQCAAAEQSNFSSVYDRLRSELSRKLSVMRQFVPVAETNQADLHYIVKSQGRAGGRSDIGFSSYRYSVSLHCIFLLPNLRLQDNLKRDQTPPWAHKKLGFWQHS